MLFTLIAECYVFRSPGTSWNPVFSGWVEALANPMAIAAAVARIVHHSIIFEIDLPSYWTDVTQQRQPQTTVKTE